jgi:hypothetical protein
VDGQDLTHYILLQEGPEDVYENNKLGIAFKGRFGMVAVDGAGALHDLYIGSGHHLDYKGTRVAADAATLAVYRER